MPETQEGIAFDEMGHCTACQSSEQKMHISWIEREKLLRKILEEAKQKAGDNYDCIIPVSGGKDSAYQVYLLTQVYGMKPLAVTFNHNWQSKTGWYNLQNMLESFNIDHIMLTPNRDFVNKIAKRSLEQIGDPCWHCHFGVGSFPLQIAVKFKIPLLIWGESVAETSGRASYFSNNYAYDSDYFLKISAKKTTDMMRCAYISSKDLFPFELPTYTEMEQLGIRGIHIGDYIFYDEEKQTEFLKEHFGWKETEMENAYKGYKSVECIMAGLHDYTCYLKRGFGRATCQACVDIRNGLMTRDEGLDISKKDTFIPEALDYFLKKTGMTKEEFYACMKNHRIEKIKNIELQNNSKTHPNREKILPFVEQIINELSNLPDPREKND
jgi:N-acetyl sugar amidotransferase